MGADDRGPANGEGLAITDEQRNGSISAIAIVLGFSLSFTGSWSQEDNPWSVRSLLVMSIAIAGIVLQLRALFGLVALPVVTLPQHRSITAGFRLGIGTVLTGFVINVICDVLADLGR